MVLLVIKQYSFRHLKYKAFSRWLDHRLQLQISDEIRYYKYLNSIISKKWYKSYHITIFKIFNYFEQ